VPVNPINQYQAAPYLYATTGAQKLLYGQNQDLLIYFEKNFNNQNSGAICKGLERYSTRSLSTHNKRLQVKEQKLALYTRKIMGLSHISLL